MVSSAIFSSFYQSSLFTSPLPPYSLFPSFSSFPRPFSTPISPLFFLVCFLYPLQRISPLQNTIWFPLLLHIFHVTAHQSPLSLPSPFKITHVGLRLAALKTTFAIFPANSLHLKQSSPRPRSKISFHLGASSLIRFGIH